MSQKRYRYTGMEKDDETGLSYHHHRYYATWLGRWTSSDPIGLGGGINRYGYCDGNPITGQDSSGLATLWDVAEDATGMDLGADPFLAAGEAYQDLGVLAHQNFGHAVNDFVRPKTGLTALNRVVSAENPTFTPTPQLVHDIKQNTYLEHGVDIVGFGIEVPAVQGAKLVGGLAKRGAGRFGVSGSEHLAPRLAGADADGFRVFGAKSGVAADLEPTIIRAGRDLVEPDNVVRVANDAPKIRAFAHGTDLASARSIKSGGLDVGQLMKQHHGGGNTGSWFAFEIEPFNLKSEGVDLARSWASVRSGNPAVIIGHWPEDVITTLTKQRSQSGAPLLDMRAMHGSTEIEAVFHPEAFGRLNSSNVGWFVFPLK